MAEDSWPVLSVEEAFSSRPYHHPTNLVSVESLLSKILPDFQDTTSNLHFPVNNTEHASPTLVFDQSKPKKFAKKVTFALAEETSKGEKAKNPAEDGMSLEEARFDIRKFSIEGSEGREKEEAKIQLALKLGAKRPKRKRQDYNELKERLKEKRAQRLDKRAIRRKEGAGVKKIKNGKVVKRTLKQKKNK